MPNEFKFSIPTGSGESENFTLNAGDVLYVLGANGSGKSSLVSRLFNEHQAHAKRISAHRQTWFESNTLDITPLGRQRLENNLKMQDVQARSRYWEYDPAGRSNMAIYDLINADTTVARKIAELVRVGDILAAKDEAQNPPPIQVINELMRLSNLPIEISVEEGDKIIAHKNGGSGYSVAELSDGERNAFLIAANVLTAKSGTLILIDEPERHLHRSIISPLLKALFDKRKDCAFIVSTHDLMLPVDTPEASTILLRNCEYVGQSVTSWVMDIIPPRATIDEDLKRDILGARRKMLFVEGTAQSLDTPLYSVLFPQVSIIGKEGCRSVEYAVRGLRGTPDMHWVSAWGIVDNDQRPIDDVTRLRAAGVWALSHYSVESLYYHPKMLIRIAGRQAQVTGADAEALVEAALNSAVAAIKPQKDHFVTNAVLRSVRNNIQNHLPRREDISGQGTWKVEIDVAALRRAEETRFDKLVGAGNWDGLLTRYPLRESQAFDRIVSGIKIVDQTTYRAAVLKLLQEDDTAVSDLRDLFGDLYATVSA